MNPGINHT